ncbi:MAG: hypothetical protein GXP62_11585 [Oligoflexia bacterium]|nr:hypothetical protein [Oligoflexia bacterium]
MSDVPGIFSKFITYAKATGAAFPGSNELPLAESTIRDYPWVRMLLRGRDRNRITGPADGFKTKIKWDIKKGYGPQEPGTPVEWKRRGSLEFLASNYCRELGTVQMIKSEVTKQIGSVWGPTQMAQQFDDVLENYMQDLYLDCTEVMEKTLQEVPNPRMEDGTTNTPRSVFMGMNEWKAGHFSSGGVDGRMPGIGNIEGYDPALSNGKMAAQTVTYTDLGPTTAANQRGHIFRAVSEGLRRVNYKAVPLAETHSQGTEGFREAFASLEGILMLQSTLAAHDNVIAEDGVDKTFTIDSRFKGMQMIDVPDLETNPICASYTAGAPNTTAAALYDAGSTTQAYFTEMNSPNAQGPRVYIPYQPHIRPIWDDDSFMNKSPLYMLDETVPDAMVCWLENFRNLHFESFRRNLVILPGANITGY